MGRGESFWGQLIYEACGSRNEINKAGKRQLLKGPECHVREWSIRLLAMERHQEPILKCYCDSHLQRRPWVENGREEEKDS